MLNKTNKETEQTMSKGKTIKQFINDNGLSMSCEYADSNPNMKDSQNMNHYKVTIKRRFKVFGNYLDSRYGFKQMTLNFSQGYGIIGEPTLESVLNCLISDSFCGENFQDFCDNLGYDNDSRKAEKTFQATLKQTSKLKKLLDNGFNDLASCEQL
jgi:hypothetical protein